MFKLRDSLRAAQIATFLLATLSVIVGLFPRRDHGQSTLPRASDRALQPASGGFLPGHVAPNTDRTAIPGSIPLTGSRIAGDAFIGGHQGSWFEARRRVAIAVAGYPNTAGNGLELEVLTKDGSLSRIPYKDANPGELAIPWTVRLPDDAQSIRVIASDGSASAHGWLGFSDPWQVKPLGFRAMVWGWLQLVAATCLALVLLWGPGLLWLRNRNEDPGALALASLVGPMLLVVLGLLTWLGGAWFAPSAIARGGVMCMLCWIAWQEWRESSIVKLSPPVRAVITTGALLVGFAVATANVSYGPKGELYGASISRTLEVGGHSDSRISYCVVQIVARHLGPFEPAAAAFFAPYSFASRGPFAGLIAAPLVLASGGEPSLEMPDQSWSPFDPRGFATYRVALIGLASLAGWTVFGVTASVSSSAWALLAAICLLFSPFYVHETYFTWPKMAAANCVLAAWLLARRSRPLLAGLAVAAGYLFHPLAILSAPVVLLWSLPRRSALATAQASRPLASWALAIVGAGSWFLLGIVALVVPWALAGRMAPAGTAQGSFIQYFAMADILVPTRENWLRVRWDNIAHTFIPFHLLSADLSHATLNSIYGLSDAGVHFGFLYWNTLPLGLGLPVFLVIAPAIVVAVRRAPWVALTTFVGPVLFLVLYWGITRTGLMRFCGHVLFLTSIVLAFWTLSQQQGRFSRVAVGWLVSTTCLTLRALDLLWMNFGRTWLNHLPRLHERFGWNDLVSMIAAASVLLVAIVLTAKQSHSLRHDLLNDSDKLGGSSVALGGRSGGR